ncbi:hypothetical protein [Aurantiacibacter gilvus]|uniref:DUF8021 domain-containing protein n=1 Tax=Aurantiacibacter gilvus TaxID=3139141 RepID=A0ABU9IDT0_9SPHN
MRKVLALCLTIAATLMVATPASAQDCDRECLRGKVTEVLHALVRHDTSGLDVAPDLRVTEDGVEKELAQVGLVRTVTRLRGYRQDIIDEHAGVGVAGVMVEESGAPIILVVRVKVDDRQRLNEIELVATRSRAEGLLFAIDRYSGAPSVEMNLAPRPEQLKSREDAVAIAMLYPLGLSNAETFNAVGTPFSDDAYRIENGMMMAGPDCTFIPGCNDIGNQSLAIFNQLGRVTVRDIVVDERMGIVLMRLSWNASGPGSDRLTAWEMFKVYDGQIHMVEAYIRLLPPELDLGGWPIAEGIEQP